MEDVDPMESGNTAASKWAVPATAKERANVQRTVDRLLDELAPERTLTRADRIPVPVERHRTPSGCILQAANAALSVSWFADVASDGTPGELQVVVWKGVVSRPGSARRVGGATVVSELHLLPVANPGSEWTWRAVDGTAFDTDALVAHCLKLLEEQIAQ